MYKKAMLKETLPAGETEMFTDHEPGRSSKDLADANGQPSAKQGVSAGTDMPRSGREAGAAGQVAEESVREKPEQQLARPALGTPMASQPATQLADRRATPLEVGANLRRLVITLNLGAPAAANAARIAVPPDAATLEQTESRPARD